MKFRELAWAAYMYNVVTKGDPAYKELFNNHGEVLVRLRQDPNTVAWEEINKSVLAFLRRWGGRHIPKKNEEAARQTAKAVIKALCEVHENVKGLQGESIISIDLKHHRCQIERVFSALEDIQCGDSARREVHIGKTFASKLAHVLNPELFVMWDNATQKRLGQNVSYYNYLWSNHEHATETFSNFQDIGFKGDPAGFLSEKLGYASPRTLAKFLDEYDQMCGDKSTLIPPDWLLAWPTTNRRRPMNP